MARDIQAQAFIDLPIGMYDQPTSYRKPISGVLPGFATFWNVKKA